MKIIIHPLTFLEFPHFLMKCYLFCLFHGFFPPLHSFNWCMYPSVSFLPRLMFFLSPILYRLLSSCLYFRLIASHLLFIRSVCCIAPWRRLSWFSALPGQRVRPGPVTCGSPWDRPCLDWAWRGCPRPCSPSGRRDGGMSHEGTSHLNNFASQVTAVWLIGLQHMMPSDFGLAH